MKPHCEWQTNWLGWGTVTVGRDGRKQSCLTEKAVISKELQKQKRWEVLSAYILCDLTAVPAAQRNPKDYSNDTGYLSTIVYAAVFLKLYAGHENTKT